MFTDIQQKLLNLNLNSFPLMAAASVALKKRCTSCPHRKSDLDKGFLKTAAIKYKYDSKFKTFLKEHFTLPVTIAGIVFEE